MRRALLALCCLAPLPALGHFSESGASRTLLPALLVGCEREASAPSVAPASSQLPSGVVARVAQSDVRADSVARIAAAQQVDLRIARDRAIFDSLAAAETRRVGDPHLLRASRRGVEARGLLELLLNEARAKGPASDAEIDELVNERWPDLDRPVSVRVVHAVARLPERGNKAEARRVGLELQRALAGVTDPTEFLNKAKSVDGGKIEIRAEPLPAITIDGRGWQTGRLGREAAGSFDVAFSKAAHAIAQPGTHSDLVETSFGFHVILLLERIPEQRIDREEARQVLADDIVTRRADRERRALLARLETAVPIAVSRNFEALTANLGAAR